jgi:hypothetical protein
MAAMSVAKRQVFWFLGLYAASIVALAVAAFIVRGILQLAR